MYKPGYRVDTTRLQQQAKRDELPEAAVLRLASSIMLCYQQEMRLIQRVLPVFDKAKLDVWATVERLKQSRRP